MLIRDQILFKILTVMRKTIESHCYLPLAICLTACVTTYHAIKLPEISDFTDASLTYTVKGTLKDVTKETTEFLLRRTIRHRQQAEEPYTYLITDYIKEPAGQEGNRIRRTAYIIKLREIPPTGQCTAASISWLVESKGTRENTWRTIKSDEDYSPNTLMTVKDLFEKRKCL